jgi:hypothetical protein
MNTASLKRLVVLVGLAGVAGLCGCSRPTALVGPPAAEAAIMERHPTQAAPERTEAVASSGSDGFRFPEDRGGQLLAKLLAPVDRAAPATFPNEQRVLPPSAAVERPATPLPPLAPSPPHLPPGKAPPPARPAPLPEESPLLSCRLGSDFPQTLHLPTGERVRTAGSDPNQPVALPVLGQGTPDRASLDDPTADFSFSAALAAPMPSRSNPAPFLRLNLPDPYEHRKDARVRTMPAEEPPTPVLFSKPPRP